MSDIVISGYYGLGNSGDEALLKCIIDDLKKVDPDVTITALSGDAQHTKRHYGVKTINRFNLFSVINELRQAKLLISGGGTLIQDATSTKSLLYYLGIIFLARKMGLKTMVYANGIGPIKEKNYDKVKKILDEVDLITLREETSLEELEKCKVSNKNVIVTADPAFNLIPSPKERADEILSKYSVKKEDKLIAVSVRACKNLPENFEEKMACSLDALAQKGYLPVFIPMQKSTDLSISLNIASKMKAPSRVMDRYMTVADMLAVIGRCEIACGMRLHMLIFASVMNVPMAGIAYDPKIKGFMNYMSQTNLIELEKFSAEQFTKLASECISNIENIKQQLEKSSEALRNKATKNAELAIDLIKNI